MYIKISNVSTNMQLSEAVSWAQLKNPHLL